MSSGHREPKSCQTCAKAKVKCDIGPGQTICNRCQRLNRECNMQLPGAHKRKGTRQSDVARLEKKLDNMASLLATPERPRGETPQRAQNPTPDSTSTEWPRLFGSHLLDTQIIPSDANAVAILNNFQTEMAPHFPFVVVPVTASIAEFRDKKPFLYMTIMMASGGQNPSRQLAMAQRIREHVSQSMLLKGEQNLDLLQGLLVYLSWYHVHFQINSQLGNLIHLVLALLVDLGLNKQPTAKVLGKASFRAFNLPWEPPVRRTLEEMRTFLGCFYITSVTSICARDMYPVQFNKYADECCRAIAEALEYPTDAYLVQLVRLQRLADKINRTLSSEEVDLATTGITEPVAMCVKSLEVELEQLKSSSALPRDSPLAPAWSIHCHSVSLCLYEVALNDSIPNPAVAAGPPSPTARLTRLQLLTSLLKTSTDFLSVFYSLPPLLYFTIPYTLWLQLGRTTVILSKLSLFPPTADGWDQKYVAGVLDFRQAIDRLGETMERAAYEAKEHGRHVPEVFWRLGPKLHMLKEAHEMRRRWAVGLQQQQQGVQGSESAGGGGGGDQSGGATSAGFGGGVQGRAEAPPSTSHGGAGWTDLSMPTPTWTSEEMEFDFLDERFWQ